MHGKRTLCEQVSKYEERERKGVFKHEAGASSCEDSSGEVARRRKRRTRRMGKRNDTWTEATGGCEALGCERYWEETVHRTDSGMRHLRVVGNPRRQIFLAGEGLGAVQDTNDLAGHVANP